MHSGKLCKSFFQEPQKFRGVVQLLSQKFPAKISLQCISVFPFQMRHRIGILLRRYLLPYLPGISIIK